LPKTLAEIAIDAGLVTKASAAKAGKMAEEHKQALVVVLVRELGVDELALVGAFGKQTRVPQIDPKNVILEHDALRSIPRDTCARLRVLPMQIVTDGTTKVLRLAMADPTDTTAVAEIESITQLEIEVSVLPLSTIDELVDKGYRQINTAVVMRPSNPKAAALVTTLGRDYSESEVSVTAQIPLIALQAPDSVEARVEALVQLLVQKGVITEAELVALVNKTKSQQ
jgi:hypothetical protein